jgi:quercetin dioxygenase-like cupin family protein
MESSQTFWHLDVYPSLAAANAARTPRGSVVSAFGKTWLLTIERADWRAAGGTHVADIGPLPVAAGHAYSAQFMEGVLDPGMTSAVHKHSGPEAWYTISGGACLETPHGIKVGRAGGSLMIVPGDLPMLLTGTGKTRRRAFALVLHQSARPPITVVRDWKPKGLCKV